MFDNLHCSGYNVVILGINEIKNLPNPRKLSTSLVDDVNLPDKTKTIAMAYWGTFISHDLSKTAITYMRKIKNITISD